ncbi:hypothetical protein [Streptomyces sp. HM190]|nr:hypothetical protein [Streptomyces sp. HM190]
MSRTAELGITVVASDLGELRARPEEDGNPVAARYRRRAVIKLHETYRLV